MSHNEYLKMQSFKILLFTVNLLITVIGGEVVDFGSCPETTKCTIDQLRVDPCPEMAKRKPCVLVKGQNATVSFDYTAGFDGKLATAKAWWTMPEMDLPFIGMDNEACKYTDCPIVAGRKGFYSYELPIMRIFPSRAYDVKWQLLNEFGEQCCFIIPIVIKNKRGRI